MKKLLVNILCAFVPSRGHRARIRNYFLPAQYKIVGTNNKIIICDDGIEKELYRNDRIDGLNIDIKGNNNLIKIPKINYFSNCNIKFDCNNATVEIVSIRHISNTNIYCMLGDNQKLLIDYDTTICGANMHLKETNSSIIIGKDCMFSNGIELWATDAHSILNKDTNEIINHITKPIIIGDRCWIGFGVVMTKNSTIPNNSIVGAASCVSKIFTQENAIIAGNPAKVIRTNIDWNRASPNALARRIKNS